MPRPPWTDDNVSLDGRASALHELVLSVFGLAVLLAMAVLLLPVSGWLRIPYTVLLAVAGIALGLGIEGLRHDIEGLWLIGDAFAGLDDLDITSKAVLFIFLPGLVFNSAMSIDVRRLIDNIAPIMSLAVVGLLLSTAAVGYTINLVSGVELLGCLLLGAIVSATDPVAVVALFRDLGAPKRLALLVEGESPFNDATAIVLFGILLAMLTSSEQTGVAAGIIEFIRVFLGGVLVGAAMALAALCVISRLKIPFAQTTLTLCLAWLAFVVAEHELHVLGVMAVVAAGLVVGERGPTSMAGSTWRSLRVMWEQMDFWATSIIFIMVGMAAPVILAEARTADLGILAVLIGVAFVARAGIIFGLIHQAANNAHNVIMVWGGLRGAVSLALALAVMENPAVPEDLRALIGVMVCGFVMFTLAVNATTIRPLLSLLRLDRLSTADQATRERALTFAIRNIDKEIARLSVEHGLDATQAPRLEHGETPETSPVIDWHGIGLAMLTRHEHKVYLDRFHDGVISPRVARQLLAHTGDLLDAIRSGGDEAYETTSQRFTGYGWRLRTAQFVQRHLGFSLTLAGELADRFQVLQAMTAAMEDVRHHALPAVAPLVGDDNLAMLAEAIARRDAVARRCLSAMEAQYPDYSTALKKRFLARMVCRVADRELKQLGDQGLIGGDVLDDLSQAIDDLRAQQTGYPSLDLGLKPHQLVARVPFLSQLPEEHTRRIAAKLQPVSCSRASTLSMPEPMTRRCISSQRAQSRSWPATSVSCWVAVISLARSHSCSTARAPPKSLPLVTAIFLCSTPLPSGPFSMKFPKCAKSWNPLPPNGWSRTNSEPVRTIPKCIAAMHNGARHIDANTQGDNHGPGPFGRPQHTHRRSNGDPDGRRRRRFPQSGRRCRDRSGAQRTRSLSRTCL
jgi:monovalent cation:H+ antiporter, CPA1 family